ncbi:MULTISPECIES: SusD/RagB family nutrient-binding outer membrane lipoprotein [unclassified Flavobacterium]|uniref:SusD/RagB family nutrient-binding outer membrane lipoprotein n=1 Tax=unclassified Flavobacterium TaxID=196869 RepID=UPI000964C34A|nr:MULTISPECIES: SusD/RagB family nutrient-binding outer membrane lipoprotein [unclassified Flavobacterium]MBN9285087.1 SusD/RagB family nutrient-binding outer membrane lipoprotein [Flavobacterium sp.]OJV69807.1 MAG: hypothetical protein BGO42_06975 [Flavobacterium sp. 40-81]
MKKLLIPILAIASLFFTGCVNDDIDFNDDTSKTYTASAEALLSNSQKELTDQMTTPSVNLNVFRYFSQYWAATLYRAESRYNLTSRRIPDNHWRVLYTRVLGNLKTAKEVVDAEAKPENIDQATWDKIQINKSAIIEILNVYTYQILVDSFGDVPYTEALQPVNIVLPKYDDDQAIYLDLLSRLNAATAQLDANFASFSKGDLLYNGNIAKWKLFANSLKVKLAINISDVNNSLAQSTIESAYTAGVITANSDNALVQFNSFSPNYNQIFGELVASNRNDFVPTSVFVDELNTLNDPRRPVFFTPMADGSYVGGAYGYTNTQPYETSYSHIGNEIKKADAKGVLFDAAEVNFYLAEAAARGYNVGGTPDTYYSAAITASLNYWNIPTGDISTYLGQSTVAYATAAGTWKEKIGKQAWIALYNRGFESWNSFRRLDAPGLTAPPSAFPVAEGKIPVRLTYPVNEQTVNGNSYQAASAAIGGDKLTTKVFWDVN